VTFVTFSVGAAQTPSVSQIPLNDSATPEQVRILLQSSDTREQIWGAALAMRKKMTDANPLVEKLVSQNLTGPSSSNRTLDTALDALISNDARLAPDLLESIYAKRPGAALALLAKIGPAADPVLLKIVGNSPPATASSDWGAWCAAANLLTQHHALGFLPKLFSLLTTDGFLVPGSVQVQRSNSFGFFFADGASLIPNTTDLPPWPGYAVLADPSNGFAGPVAVGIFRQNTSATALGKRVNYPDSEVFFSYLTALTGLATLPVHATEYRVIPKDLSPDQFAAESRRFEQDIRQQYALLLQSLQTAGFLTPEETPRLPEPKIHIH
jgi:hypothetical protein